MVSGRIFTTKRMDSTTCSLAARAAALFGAGPHFIHTKSTPALRKILDASPSASANVWEGTAA